MTIPHDRDPIDLFGEWYDEAQSSGRLLEPTAVALATADASGRPSVRMVLLKGADHNGFVFYTNLESRKGRQLGENPRAALCFYWEPVGRQVRVEGPVAPVDDDEADAYFATRPRDAQLGAWASKQSAPLDGVLELERRVAKYALKFGLGRVRRPEFWSGFRLTPERIEFWQRGGARLHERMAYERASDDWTAQRLYP